jgi:hypothetical protein
MGASLIVTLNGMRLLVDNKAEDTVLARDKI